MLIIYVWILNSNPTFKGPYNTCVALGIELAEEVGVTAKPSYLVVPSSEARGYCSLPSIKLLTHLDKRNCQYFMYTCKHPNKISI